LFGDSPQTLRNFARLSKCFSKKFSNAGAKAVFAENTQKTQKIGLGSPKTASMREISTHHA
jgi:hypothetical protein